MFVFLYVYHWFFWQINWVEYINGVIKGSGVKKRVDGSLKVVVFAPQFLHDLSDLIATTLARPEGVT